MKKLTIALLCATLLLGILAACGKDNEPQNTSLPSLADVRDDAMTPAGDDSKPVGEEELEADDIAEKEPAYVNDGGVTANLSDEEVVTDFGFQMEYPSGWSYLSIEELGLEDYYIFGATNRATGASIVVTQPLDAVNTSLEEYANSLFGGLGDTMALYESMGITSELHPMGDVTLGGREAKRVDLYGVSSEAEFTQSTYVLETPNGEIITVQVSTYSPEDDAVAAEALASIRWS